MLIGFFFGPTFSTRRKLLRTCCITRSSSLPPRPAVFALWNAAFASSGRPAATVDRPVELVPLVVHPAERGERIRLQLFGRGRERAAGEVERGVEVLSRLGEVRGQLVVADGSRRRRYVPVEKLPDHPGRFGGPSLGTERLGEDRARRRRDDLLRTGREDLPAGGDRLLPEAERRGQECEGNPDRRVRRLCQERLAIQLVCAPPHTPRERLLGAPVGLRAGAGHVRQRIELPPLQDSHGFLVLEPPRIFLEGLVKALEGALQTVLLQVAQPQLKDRFLQVGLEPERFLEVADRARSISFFLEDRPEQHVRRRLRRYVERFPKLLLRLVPARCVRVQRSQCEVRKEGVRSPMDCLLVESLRRLDLARFPGDDSAINQRLEMVRLHGEHLLQIAGGPLHVARREEGLRQIEAELRVAAIDFVELFERADPAVGIERQQGELRLAEPFCELLAVASGEARHDAVAPLQETILLLDRLHALVELRLPEVADFLGADDSPALEGLLQCQNSGVGDEKVPLEVSERLEERLDRVAGALDELLERRNPLEEVLIQGDLFLRFAPLLDDPDPGEDEQLRLAADAEFLVVGVSRAADLAEHQEPAAGYS